MVVIPNNAFPTRRHYLYQRQLSVSLNMGTHYVSIASDARIQRQTQAFHKWLLFIRLFPTLRGPSAQMKSDGPLGHG